MPTSISDFAQQCVDKSNDEIYELFGSINSDLRYEILSTFWSISECSEPVRSAMRQMGERYCVVPLQNY